MPDYTWDLGVSGAENLKDLSSAAKELLKTLSGVGGTQRTTAGEHAKAAQAVKNVTIDTIRFGNTVQTVRKELDTEGNTIRKTVTLKENLGKQVKTTTTAYKGEEEVIKTQTATVDKAHTSWRQWLATLAHGGQTFMALKSAVDTIKSAVMGAISPLMQFGTELDMSQSRLDILAGKSYPALIKQVETLSRKFGTTRAELIKSQVSLLRGGMTPKAVQEMLPKIVGLHEKGLGEPEQIASSIGGGFGNLTRALILPTRETARLKFALKELGVGFNELKGLADSPTQMIKLLGDAIARVPNEAKKIALVKRIFGEAWETMLPLLSGWKGGNAPINQTFEELKATVVRVYESLSRLFKAPILAFFGSLRDIVSKVEERFAALAEKFGSTELSMSQWIDVIKSIFKDVVEIVKKEGKPIWDAIVTPDVLDKMGALGRDIGKAIVDGILWGIKEAANRIPTAIMSALESRSVSKLKAAVQQDLAAEAASRGVAVTIPAKTAAMANLPMSATAGANLAGMEGRQAFAVPQKAIWQNAAGVYTNIKTDPQRAEKLRILENQISSLGVQLRSGGATPEEKTEMLKKTMELVKQRRELESQTKEISADELETKAGELKQAQALSQQTLDLKKQTEQLALSEGKVTLEIQKSGSEFSKWLLEPVNIFLQKLKDIKDKFAEMITSLKEKGIDLGEKFGLIKPGEAAKQRTTLAKESLEQAQDRLKLAQTPAERQAAFEGLAGKAERVAELTKGGEQKGFAEKAGDYLKQAQEEAKKAQANEEQKVLSDQKLARESIPQLQAMIGKAETKEKALDLVKQLQAAYQSLGRVDESIKLQADVAKLTREAAGETNSLLKQLVEIGRTQIEILKLNKPSKNGAETQPQIIADPLNDAYPA
jgi:hypothetical protein